MVKKSTVSPKRIPGASAELFLTVCAAPNIRIESTTANCVCPRSCDARSMAMTAYRPNVAIVRWGRIDGHSCWTYRTAADGGPKCVPHINLGPLPDRAERICRTLARTSGASVICLLNPRVPDLAYIWTGSAGGYWTDVCEGAAVLGHRDHSIGSMIQMMDGAI